ncbi:Suppressor of glycerol defect protein 1 [Yarrowia sp. E02]|nr:Suppressor of glycerol defect protein 1 [Yarrowia sp. E02]
MAGPRKGGKDAKKGINLPGVMLDELRELGMSSDRPQSGGNKRKSGGSRKEQRKQERQLKKQKFHENKRSYEEERKAELKEKAKVVKKPVKKSEKKSEKKGVKKDKKDKSKDIDLSEDPVDSVEDKTTSTTTPTPKKGLLRGSRTPGSGRSVTWAAKDRIREFGHSLDGEEGQEYEQDPEERAQIKKNTFWFEDDEEDTEEDEPDASQINSRVGEVMEEFMGGEGDLDRFMSDLRARQGAGDDGEDESDDSMVLDGSEDESEEMTNQQKMSLKRINSGSGTASGGLSALRKRGPSVSEDIPGVTRASKSFSFSEDYGSDNADTDDDGDLDDGLSVADTMALLAKKKSKKVQKDEELDDNLSVADTMALLKAKKNKRSIEEVESSSEEEEDEEDFDEDDMDGIPPDDELDSDDFDSDIDEEDMVDYHDLSEEDDDEEEELDDSMSVSDTMALLKAKKAGKKAGKKPVESDEELDDSMSVSDTMALLKAKKDAKKSKKAPVEESDEEVDDTMSVEDTMALLKAKKAKKGKEGKKGKESKEEKPKKEKREYSDLDSALMRKDEEEMDYYAKKLGFKDAKSANLGSDDELGGILDGLDMDFGFDSEGESDIPELVEEKPKKKSDKKVEKKEKKKTVNNDLPWSEDEVDSDDFDTDSEDDSKPRVKENPYVAPVAANADGSQPAKYVPPSLRKKLAMEVDPDTKEMVLIRRKIKGSLNKLSESNIGSIINEILRVFDDNPRMLVTTVVTECLLESTASETVLLETFLLLHAVIATILYRQVGVSFGAYFVQSLVEKFFTNYAAGTHMACSNLLAFLTEIYYFQMVSCTLVYDLIRKFLADPNERNTEYLLKIVRFSGSQLRSDDPSALKTIINDLQASLANTETNARTKFLVESVAALKNNRQSQHGISQGYTEAKMRLKKFIGTFSSYTVNEPISVSLDDIENVETRGKWWLVGAAFKNQDQTHQGDDDLDLTTVHDVLDAAEPNWLELAREQRMNTDIRRAVFVAIMGAEDYLNALERVSKLRLKRVQEREIPRVLIHCCSNESVYNPFYALLAVKLAERHSLKMTFQFTLWDFFRELDGDEDDDEENSDEEESVKVLEGSDSKELLRKTMNLARMFAQMTAEGTVGLNIFKNVNFLTASENMKIFLEMYFVALFGMLGKRAEEGQGGKTRDQKQLVKMLVKLKDNALLLRGIQYFVSEIVVKSDLIVKKRERQRVLWGRDVTTDIVDELTKAT